MYYSLLYTLHNVKRAKFESRSMFLKLKKLVFLVRFVHKIRACRSCTKNRCSTWKLLSDGILPIFERPQPHPYIRTVKMSLRRHPFCGAPRAVCCCSASFSHHCLSVDVHYCLYMQVSCLRHFLLNFMSNLPLFAMLFDPCRAVAPRRGGEHLKFSRPHQASGPHLSDKNNAADVDWRDH